MGSLLSALLIGVAMGNIAWGVPLDADHEFAGSFLGLLRPYPLLMGVTTVALFMMHGSIYLVMKTEGAMHEKVRVWVNRCIIFFIICYVTVTMASLLYVPHLVDVIRARPAFFALAVLNMLAIANIPRSIHLRRDFIAFLSSCASIVMLLALFGLGMYPNMIFSIPPENSLTIYNGASSQKTLAIMGWIALIGVPLVLTYTACIYWVFRGKVKLDKLSY